MSRIGARIPILAASGRKATRNDGNAIAMTEPMSACFRPYRSPIQPNSAPPTGRITNPAANVPNAASTEEVGSCAGKKCAPICGAKNPNSAKSYHSSMLPTTPAAMPRCTVFGVRNSWVMTLPGTIGGGIGIVVMGRRSGSRSYATRPARRLEPEAAS
jgi:hypothetical protein